MTIFPEKWKIAFIIYIFKAGDKNDIRSYRPISISKILEKILFSKINDYLSKFIIEQHGGIYGRPIVTNSVNSRNL